MNESHSEQNSADDMSADDRRFLREAAAYLERPSLVLRLAALTGKPVEALLATLPTRATDIITHATHSALETALRWACATLPKPAPLSAAIPARANGARKSRFTQRWHTAAAAAAGAAGGIFGLPGLAIELPATTTIMLRSIASVAAEHGADLSDPATRLECLWLLSLGGRMPGGIDSAYLSARLSMALAMREAATFVAQHSARELSEALAKGAAPPLLRLINQIASRFSTVASQKFAVQAAPIAGSAAGALINAAFTDHFNSAARYHFGIVELERRYGREQVQAAYAQAMAENAKNSEPKANYRLTRNQSEHIQ